ncbi:hypothetical protein SEUCBS140593_005228 [Sporothrix eucalyptigena]|uniref:MARVEL domain-containing protein n=1 Tax=Sporothrix eucalyptigena TaxID=1812306 RepID=A0ABP0BUY1_9PEZI
MQYQTPYQPYYPRPIVAELPPPPEKKQSFSFSTLLFTIFRVATLTTNIPIIIFAAHLLQSWPDYFEKAGIPLGAGVLAIVSDIWAIACFWQRHKAFVLSVLLDLVAAILGAVGVFSMLNAGFNSSNVPLTDAQNAMEAQWARDQDFAIIFSGVVCGLRALSLFANSILSCLIFSRGNSYSNDSSRYREQHMQTTELY